MSQKSGAVRLRSARIWSEVDRRPRTVSGDVMAQWDVGNKTGLVIGSEQPVDASSCQINTRINFAALM